MFDEILEKFGLKYEDLNTVEKETLRTWYTSISDKTLTLETLKAYISAMRDSVESDLENFENSKEKDLFLKARLRNYRLIEAFLTTPERAKQAFERSVAALVPHKGK